MILQDVTRIVLVLEREANTPCCAYVRDEMEEKIACSNAPISMHTSIGHDAKVPWEVTCGCWCRKEPESRELYFEMSVRKICVKELRAFR